MKRVYTIEDNLSLVVNTKKRKTVVTVIDNGEKINLADIKTNEYFWCKAVFDENYIAVYSRGCMVNNIPLKIEAAYSIKERKILNVEHKRFRVLLEYMLICKKGFDVSQVLQTINEEDLEIVEETEKDDLTRYLTAECGQITHKEVVDYILKQYPELKNYTNLSGPISVIRYKKLKEEIEDITGKDCLWFHVMPLPLKYISNPKMPYHNPDADNYKQIYISEEEHREKE